MIVGQLKISGQLKDALQNYESFLSYVQAYGAWARSDPDRPCNYKCPIKYQSGYPEPKAMQISEEDALAMDAAFAEYTKANRMNKLLFEWTVIRGHDCGDVIISANDLRKAMRKRHEPYTLINVLNLYRNLIEQVRGWLLLQAEQDEAQKAELDAWSMHFLEFEELE